MLTDEIQPQSISIMIIDDSVSERKQLSAKLEQLGYQVNCQADGEHAVDYLSQHQGIIDLILLDVVMPGTSGFETAQNIRQMEEHQDDWCPIIFLSGSVSSNLISKGIQTGGDDYLSKPVDTVVLEAKIMAMQRIVNRYHILAIKNKRLDYINKILVT